MSVFVAWMCVRSIVSRSIRGVDGIRVLRGGDERAAREFAAESLAPWRGRCNHLDVGTRSADTTMAPRAPPRKPGKHRSKTHGRKREIEGTRARDVVRPRRT